MQSDRVNDDVLGLIADRFVEDHGDCHGSR